MDLETSRSRDEGLSRAIAVEVWSFSGLNRRTRTIESSAWFGHSAFDKPVIGFYHQHRMSANRVSIKSGLPYFECLQLKTPANRPTGALVTRFRFVRRDS